MSRRKHHLTQVLITVGVLLVFLVATTPWSPVANAAFEGCRADPIVYLSDGTTLIVTVDIGTDASNITLIGYSIHVPRGVKMLDVEHTDPPGFAGKAQFSFKDDARPNEYMTDTIVQLKSLKGIPIVATTTRNKLTKVVSGVNGEHLRATLTF